MKAHYEVMSSKYLTPAQELRYWKRSLDQVTDFYLDGCRFLGGVKIVKGRLIATEVCGAELDSTQDLTDLLIVQNRMPHTGGGREIFMDVPDSVLMAISRKGKPAGMGATFINV